MRKFFKNQKGFTLIELMMVIAVIAILAAVLIPKVSGIKDEAKNTGVDANVRTIKAHAESLIGKYGVSNAEAFEDALAGKLSDLVNPVSNDTGVGAIAGVGTDSTKAVVRIDNNINNDAWATDAGKKGCVGISAYVDGNKLKLKIQPFKAADGAVGTAETVE